MNKTYAALLLLAMTFLLLSPGCKAKHTSPGDRNEVSVGETFQISIKDNPTTPTRPCWTNKKGALAVSLVKKEYKGEGSSDCTGCGGTATFTFKGVAPGTDTILLGYCSGVGDEGTCDECGRSDPQVDKFIAVVK